MCSTQKVMWRASKDGQLRRLEAVFVERDERIVWLKGKYSPLPVVKTPEG